MAEPAGLGPSGETEVDRGSTGGCSIRQSFTRAHGSKFDDGRFVDKGRALATEIGTRAVEAPPTLEEVVVLVAVVILISNRACPASPRLV